MKNFLDLKVYRNKRNGQLSVPLPKRKLKSKKIPKTVKVKW